MNDYYTTFTLRGSSTMPRNPSCEKYNNSQNSFAFGMLYGHSKKLKLLMKIFKLNSNCLSQPDIVRFSKF